MNKLFITIGIIFSFMSLMAQEENNGNEKVNEKKPVYFDVIENQETAPGVVKIQQDPEIRNLVERHVDLNISQGGRFAGYRIEIFSENGYGAREAALKARKRFNEKYPDIDAYESYDGINFKVRVGDFRFKDKAKKIQVLIISDYPSTFIVKELIEQPNLRE